MLVIEWNRNGKILYKKVYKIQYSFFPEIEKTNEIRTVIKHYYLFLQMRNKVSLPESHVKF